MYMSLVEFTMPILLAVSGFLFFVWQHERSRRKRAERILFQTRTSLHDAMHDTLTGLPTKELLEEKLADIMVGYRRTSHTNESEQLVLFFIDVNNLKTMNDTHGHDAGNALLTHTAEALVEATRESDVVGRLYGDEFIVAGVYTADGDTSTIEAAAQRILDTVATVVVHDTVASVSIGIAVWDKVEDLDAWKRRADKAMYKAKKQHANTYSW